MRADDLEMFWERLGVRVVGLSQFVHPAIMEDGPRVVFWQLLAVFIKTLEVVQRRRLVDCVSHFFFTHSSQRNLLLNDETGQEVGGWHDRVKVMTASGFFIALGVVAAESGVDEAASLVDLHTAAVPTHDVVDTGVDIGSAKNHLTHLFTVTGGDTDRDRQFLGDLGWHTDFIDAKVGVRRNHRASTEVDTLTGKVASEPSFLALESLSERFEGSAGAVASGWDAGCLVVKVGRDVVLEQFPKVFNNQLRSTGVSVFSQSLVDSKDVDEFVCQIVFGPVTAVERN